MKRLALNTLVVLISAALVPSAALAKGASEATITGPGLGGPIELSGSGEPGSSQQLGEIAEMAGFFQAVFGQSPDPMLAERPAGDLGPRYMITYVMPGPNNQVAELRQDVYPYATPDPVTYTKPGQRFWTTEETRGGWYVASYSSLKDQLIAAGLPPSPPTVGGDDRFPWILTGSLVALGAILGVGVLAALHGRRRPDTATA